MRLQEVLKLTQISKRTIYFYIEEKLITPIKNLENGYYDFSEEDLMKLQAIIALRKIDMSIQDIKELFQYPRTTNFFIHRQINILKNNIYEQVDKLRYTYSLIQDIPINATPINLEILDHRIRDEVLSNEVIFNTIFPNVDSRMIAILICAPFTDIRASEYHNFLWDRISSELELQFESNLIYLKKLIYNLTPKQIRKISLQQYKFSKEIAEINECNEDIYVEQFYYKCIELSNNIELQNYWRLLYDPILVSLLSFFRCKGGELLGEYNPTYEVYNKNMKKVAINVYKKLKENYEIADKLYSAFNINFNDINYLELIYLYTFEYSIFTQINLDVVKELLNKER